ncbi:hypothetical protein CIC85_004272 [Escherichia coli]|nr:hypothetical protein [Escherichia coli]
MLPSETMIWQPEFTDKTLSRKPGAVQIPVFLVLSGLLSAGYPGLLCITVSGCYFSGIAAFSLRAKDPVGLCWSVFSFILLYLLLKK